MPLHDVAVEPAVHHHRPFHIHHVAHFEQSEVAAVEGFLHCRNGVVFAVELHHSQAYAVVGNALVDFQLRGKRAGESQVDVFTIFIYVRHAGHLFNYSTEHTVVLSV